jgi:ribosomal protein L40E
MGSFIEPFGSTGDIAYQTTEHYLQRVLVGNVVDVRRRLNDVLQRLDYDFIAEGEFGIEARRNVRGWAGAYSSADVLDYQRTLTINLKPLSDNATGASFAYVIKHPSLQRGEKAVLTREAETIAELARIRAIDKICAVCGADADGDSRFCRKCGAPMTGDETALEVLRMTGHIRAGYTSVVAGSLSLVASLISMLAMFIVLMAGGISIGALATTFFAIALGSALVGLYCLGFGWRRMSRSLDSGNKDQKVLPHTDLKTLPVAIERELSERVPFSIADGTTELLGAPARIRSENTTNDLSK